MSKFSKDLVDFKIKFYSNIIKDMSSLLTITAVLFYIEYFSQYLMACFHLVDSSDTNYVGTGAGAVRQVTCDDVLYYIIKLRNAIVHCDVNNIKEYIALLKHVDFYEGPHSSNDALTIKGYVMLSSVDWDSLENYLLDI